MHLWTTEPSRGSNQRRMLFGSYALAPFALEVTPFPPISLTTSSPIPISHYLLPLPVMPARLPPAAALCERQPANPSFPP